MHVQATIRSSKAHPRGIPPTRGLGDEVAEGLGQHAAVRQDAELARKGALREALDPADCVPAAARTEEGGGHVLRSCGSTAGCGMPAA